LIQPVMATTSGKHMIMRNPSTMMYNRNTSCRCSSH
jgi:hypothetical protein